MRFFRFKHEMNWKYILGEVFLIFVGISLAIGFNNWNASNKLEDQKTEALQRIHEEILNNLDEQKRSREINQRFIEGYKAYAEFFIDDTNNLLISSDELSDLRSTYPGLYSIFDSTRRGDKYMYLGGVNAGLSLPELSSIAWQTSKSIGVTRRCKCR